jgi:NDP-sugar pyrophosphorylase family protein
MKADIPAIDVFILGGGKGKRLRSVCKAIPKPMVLVAGKPFLDLLLGRFARMGLRRFVLGTGYRAGVIEGYYKKKPIPGINISFSREISALGTGGAVKFARRRMQSDPFFVVNGDSLACFNALEMLRFHKRKKALVTVLLEKRERKSGDYGLITLGKGSLVTQFREKSGQASGYVNAGVYLFDRRVFALMPGRRVFSLENDLFPGLAGKNIFGFRGAERFMDIGTPRRYALAKKMFKTDNGTRTSPDHRRRGCRTGRGA